MIGIDPSRIRVELELQRALGTPYREAWAIATSGVRLSKDDQSVVPFMEAHFRAAYYDTPSSLGRCRVPERDVSNALLMAGRPAPATGDHDRCRSGDGCDRLATRGRFGRAFCDYHADELERLATKLQLDREAADPRKNGNNVIFQGRGTRAAA